MGAAGAALILFFEGGGVEALTPPDALWSSVAPSRSDDWEAEFRSDVWVSASRNDGWESPGRTDIWVGPAMDDSWSRTV